MSEEQPVSADSDGQPADSPPDGRESSAESSTSSSSPPETLASNPAPTAQTTVEPAVTRPDKPSDGKVASLLPLMESSSITNPLFDPSKSLLGDTAVLSSIDETLSSIPVMGGYRVQKLLGEGAMGKVYLGRHEVLGRLAAIKVLHNEHADKEAVERFFLEARAASNIENPGIVQVYDVGENENGSFLVMELLEGEPLEDRLLRSETLEVREAVRFAVQIASALQAAHDNNIVHRDLKPGNLFIAPDPAVSGGERIKILDFGIAKVMASTADTEVDIGEAANISQTRSDMLLGSPTYMSPEQCRGAQSVDGRADLYSLGCILFEMLCGRPPFDQQVVAAVIAAHLRDEPPDPTDFRPEISPELAAVMMRLLVKDADERYQTADEFIRAIVHDAGHSLVAATGVTRTLLGASRFFSTMVREPRKRPFALLGTLGALAALVFLVVSLGTGSGGGQSAHLLDGDGGTYVPPGLTAPPRPTMQIGLLSTPTMDGSRDGDGGAVMADPLAQTDDEAWDESNIQALMEAIASGESIDMIDLPPTIQMRNGKMMIPWHITSEPTGASIRFKSPDGLQLPEGSVTPLKVWFEPVERSDTLIVTIDGYEEEEVEVKFNLPQRKEVNLVVIPEVTLATEPAGALLYIDGGDVGESMPWTTELSRKSKPRQISIRLDGFEDEVFELKPGMTFDEPIKLTPLTEVTLATKPKKVQVIENGEVVGTTPFTTKFSVRTSTVRVLTLHYNEKYDDFEVRLGKDESLEVADEVIELVPKVKISVQTKPKKVAIFEAGAGQVPAAPAEGAAPGTSPAPVGEPVAETPWTIYMSRKDSPRNLLLRLEGYEDMPLQIGPEIQLPRKLALERIPVHKLDSKPRGAQILNPEGVEIAATPHSFPMPRAQPTLALLLRTPGYEDLPVTLEREQKPPRSFRMVKLPRIVLATAPKQVEVYDQSQQLLGQTPYERTFAQDEKELGFVLKKEGYLPYELTVAYGEKPPRKIRMEALPKVVVATAPKGIEVHDQSGTRLGLTPYKRTFTIGEKELRLTLRKDGYVPKELVIPYGEKPPRKIRMERLPTVVVATQPKGIEVFGQNDKKLGLTPYERTFALGEKELRFTLRKEGYLPKELVILYGEKPPRKIRMERLPTIVISTDPKGIEIYNPDGQKIGITPYEQTFAIGEKELRFTLRKDGYLPQELVIPYGQKPPRKIRMVRLPTIVIATDPKKVEVYDQSGKKLGVTPYERAFTIGEKELRFALRKDGYQPQELVVEIGKKPPRKIRMVSLPRITIVTDPKKADVYDQNGEKLGVTPYKRAFALGEKEVRLSLRKPGYQPYELVVPYGGKAPRKIRLKRVPSVVIATNVRNVDVYDERGQKVGQTPHTHPFGVDKRPLRFTLRKEGYRPVELEFKYGQKAPKRIDMVSLFAQVLVRTKPKGVSVYRYEGQALGKKLGETPLQVALESDGASLPILLRKDGYSDAEFTLRPNQPKPKLIELGAVVEIRIACQPAGVKVYSAKGSELATCPYSVTVPRSRKPLLFTLRLKEHNEQTVRIVPTRSREKTVRLLKTNESVVLTVTSAPSGADVLIDDKKVGQTPFSYVPRKRTGRTRFVVKMDGYQKVDSGLRNNKSGKKHVQLERCNLPNLRDLEIGLVDPDMCID